MTKYFRVAVYLLLLVGVWASSGQAEDGKTFIGTAVPDLFTGTMSYSVPLEVPPGRNGMQPELALTYRSGNGNGWLGVGWELEVGAIERDTRNGLDYSGDAYVYRTSGAAFDLINIGGDEYRSKIEADFIRFRKLPASDGIYWEATDRTGTRYLFGQTSAVRQDDPADSNRVFKWCLERVEDLHQNYVVFTYVKDQGEVYLERIDYAPGNYVKFHLEDREDSAVVYDKNYAAKLQKRIKTIEIGTSGSLYGAYNLEYKYSNISKRSVLIKIEKFGKDAVLDADNKITSGSSLPPIVLEYQEDSNAILFTDSLSGASTATHSFINSTDKDIIAGDWNGDGRTDLLHLHPDADPNRPLKN